MSVIAIPKSLRDKLGDDGVDALLTVFSEVTLSSRVDLATKDDIRVLRDDMSKLEVKIESVKSEIEKSGKEIIKWMLAFWASQIGILIASIAVMFRFFIK